MSATKIDLNVDGNRAELDNPEDSTMDFTVEVSKGDRRCELCGEEVVEYAVSEYPLTAGWIHTNQAGADPELCYQYDFDDVRRYHELTDSAEITARQVIDAGYQICTPQPTGPGAFANWAGITVAEEHLEVQISVGDPRGCFTMRLWQGEDEAGNTRLYLSVPHPDDTTPHRVLTPLSDRVPGTFIVG